MPEWVPLDTDSRVLKYTDQGFSILLYTDRQNMVQACTCVQEHFDFTLSDSEKQTKINALTALGRYFNSCNSQINAMLKELWSEDAS